MRFSKRPRPMDFGGPDEDPHAAEAANMATEPMETSEPVGFRTMEASRGAHAVVMPGARAVTASGEPDGYAALDPADPPPSGWPTWLIAFAVAALWALAPIAFAVGYRNKVAPLQDDAFALTVFALLAVGPAIFVLGAAYLIRQAQKLGYETRRARAMAEDMLAPAVAAAARAGDVTLAGREEIERAAAAAG